jgi:S-DNA-T family DNA segregation ATPase FtsK/SpoIIIE
MNLSAPQPAIEADRAAALVADVAVARIEREMHDSPGRKSLFSIVDLGPELTSAIALEAGRRIKGAEIYINPALQDGSLPESMLSSWSATHIRNMERPSGEGVILFAVTTEHLDVVGATVKEIKQISEEALSQAPELWLSRCQDLKDLSPRMRDSVGAFMRGAYAAGLVSGGLPMLSRFVLRLDEEYQRNARIEKALDNALAAFRIPAGAGRFKDFPQRGRIKSAEKWAEDLAELHRKAEDALYLRNDRGAPLDRDVLRARVRELASNGRMTQTERDVLIALLDDGSIQAGSWRPSQVAASRLRWEVFEPVLKISKTATRSKLSEATSVFFRTYYPAALDEEDRHLLDNDIVETGDADDAEREFFFKHRETLKDDKRLLKRWEAFIFRKTEEHADLLSGILIAAADLVGAVDQMPEDPVLVLRLEGADRTNYFKNKNTDICRFLRDRFRGLAKTLSPAMECDFGTLWTHSDVWDNKQASEKTSLLSRQFKFDICLVSRSEAGSKDVFKTAQHATQLVWTMPANSFANSYTVNMTEVANAGGDAAYLGSGRFSRSQRTDRVVDGIIDLQDRSTVQDVFDSPQGTLVNMNDPDLDEGSSFLAALDELSGEVLLPADAARIREAFEAFGRSYAQAVRAFVSADGEGIADASLYEQSRLFGDLLRLLRQAARNDDCRKRLWRPMLSVGMAHSLDRPSVAISCPWHPFRLAEAGAKAEKVAEALSNLLGSGGNGADLRTYARSVSEVIGKAWHPTMTLVHGGSDPKLLIETEEFAGFALLEPPTLEEGAEDAFDGYAKEATAALLEQSREYLDLNPHERANFSVVLYNADNRDLPSRLADQLARKIESESDLRCDLILTHTNQQRLRQIYAEQNVTISRELDGVLASEAAQTFLSRLRVGFLDVDSVGNGTTARKADIVLLHDVIARGARTAWRRVPVPRGGWPSFAGHLPDAETRRLSHGMGERKSETLLVPASRPAEVQHYVDMIHDLHRDEKEDASEHYVPVREVNFDDPRIADAIGQAHKVAEWVVTFDGIANEQLLKNNGINVIRNIAWPGSSHNVIVSTKKPSKPLKAKLAGQIATVTGKAGDAAAAFADSCINEAASISGRVVLRAARQENHALELLGLMLSKQVLLASLPGGIAPVAWLQLDDFSEPLGLKSRKKADILALCVGEEDGQPVLDVNVIESKFVSLQGEAEEAAKSLDQTRATTLDLKNRIVLDGDVLNRGLWRSRLADLLLEHGVFPRSIADRDPRSWSTMVRSGDANIRIRGMSFVFVHDCIVSKPEPNPQAEPEIRQYVFDRPEIARIFRAFETPGSEERLAVGLPSPAFCGKPPAGQEAGNDAGEAPPVGPVPRDVPQADQETAARHAAETAPARPAPASEPAPEPSGSHDGGGEAGRYPKSVRAYIDAFPATPEAADAVTWLADVKVKLRQALRSYGMDTEITGERLTPNAALVKFKGNDTMTVANVEKRKEVLQTSHSLVVTDVRPGNGEVLVMVRRPTRTILSLPELWRRRMLPETAPVLNGSFLLGEREDDGELLYLNIFGENGGQPQHGPHTLIAGESGGGKGVLTRNILLDLLATNSPRNVRVRFVDPKFGADYPWLRNMPHLDGGIVETQEGAIETLEELVAEMDRRYAEITKIAPNIEKYNQKVEEAARLPRIFLFHDEIGDWMADKGSAYPDAVSSHVVRLASKARAAGVHLVLITQRPDKDAMPSQIKANVGNKICLKVASGVNSRIVLDEGGAEQLLGRGHFAAKLANEVPMGQSSLIIGQSPFIDDDDAWELAAAITGHWGRAG